MPTGIVLKSASHEVSEEQREKNLAAVVEAAGYELPEKEAPVEPKRDDFKSEEEFEAAHVAWQDTQDEKEDEKEEEIEVATSPATKKPSRKERAVARATAELQRKYDAAQLRIAELEKKEEPAKEQPRPKRADFESDEKYEDALLAWGVVKATQEKAVKDAQEAEKARVEQIIGNYGLQVEEAKEAHPDWDELKAKFEKEDVNIGNATQLAILELENGAEVTYYLMRHPAYAAKLGKMSQVSAVMEVGRLSAKLNGGTGASASDEADSEEKPKPKPKVPAPVRTVSTGGSSAVLTFAEIAAKPDYPGKAKDLRAAQAAGR